MLFEHLCPTPKNGSSDPKSDRELMENFFNNFNEDDFEPIVFERRVVQQASTKRTIDNDDIIELLPFYVDLCGQNSTRIMRMMKDDNISVKEEDIIECLKTMQESSKPKSPVSKKKKAA
jgi:hypothetical protein